MSRIITVGAAQLGPIQRADSRASGGQAHARAAAPGGRARLRPRRLSRAGADYLLPALVDDDQDEIDALLRARDAGHETRAAVRRGAAAGHRLLSGLCRARPARSGRASLQHLDPGRRRRQDRRQYRKIHLPGHAEHEPWRAFQHLEKRYFEVGRPRLSGLDDAWAATSACASATTGAGPRPIASWACRASSWSCSATTRRATIRPRPTTTT